jgi:cytochrome P450
VTDVVDACPYSPSDLTRLLELEPQLVKCPFPLYDVLRREEPVAYNQRLKGYVVTRHDDIVEVLRDTVTFSSAKASGPSSVTGLAQRLLDDPETPEQLRAQAERRLRLASSPVLLFTDPPLHKRQRLLVSAAFHPRRVKLLEPDVRRLTGQLIDGFIGDGEVNLVERFSIHLPMTVIAVLLGVPPENMATFKKWSNAFTSGVGSLEHSTEEVAGIFAAVDEFYDYFTARIEERRAQPQDDLLSDLVGARMEGEQPLTLDEMLQMLVQFLVAGNETTTNMLTTIVYRFATDPELQSRVRDDSGLIPALIEEVLRLEAPVQGMFRMATKDAVVGGQSVPAGSMVFLGYGSANRDPHAFERPDELDLAADRPPHLAFSRGEHFCLGANIAKLELRVAVEILLARLDDLRLACAPEDVEYHRTFILRGIEELPIAFTARS